MVLSFEGLEFFRGVSCAVPNDRISVIKVRKDRRPKNSNRNFHEFADNWFFSKFGVRYRSSALFVTASMQHAARYAKYSGHIVRVIPVSSYSYCWSPKVEDISIIESQIKVISRREVELCLDESGYIENDLDAAFSSGNELMLSCDSYVAIPISMLGRDAPSSPSLIIPSVSC